jgi:hypothetical protein
VDLAGDTLLGWSSGTTPFPIGVGRKGNPVVLMKSRIANSARDIAHPFPIMTKGFLAVLNAINASLICPAWAWLIGIW